MPQPPPKPPELQGVGGGFVNPNISNDYYQAIRDYIESPPNVPINPYPGVGPQQAGVVPPGSPQGVGQSIQAMMESIFRPSDMPSERDIYRAYRFNMPEGTPGVLGIPGSVLPTPESVAGHVSGALSGNVKTALQSLLGQSASMGIPGFGNPAAPFQGPISVLQQALGGGNPAQLLQEMAKKKMAQKASAVGANLLNQLLGGNPAAAPPPGPPFQPGQIPWPGGQVEGMPVPAGGMTPGQLFPGPSSQGPPPFQGIGIPPEWQTPGSDFPMPAQGTLPHGVMPGGMSPEQLFPGNMPQQQMQQQHMQQQQLQQMLMGAGF